MLSLEESNTGVKTDFYVYTDAWAGEYGEELMRGSAGNEWAENFAEGQGGAAGFGGPVVSGRSGEYCFAENNPFLDHPDPLTKAKELFRTGQSPFRSRD